MQNKRKETEQQHAQPGSMASYNNREDNRPGRVEDTQEDEMNDGSNKDKNRQPEDSAIQKKDENNV
ncbi:MAG TPA: hypothetical protein VGE06_04400 [Flavisolibacter sp.]